MIRPSFRLPLWAAVAIGAAAYTVRSVSRGGDFTPDLPGDVIAYGLLVLVIAAVGLARARAAHTGDDHLPEDVHHEHGAADEKGQHDDVLDEVE